jgi:hypothetical protein
LINRKLFRNKQGRITSILPSEHIPGIELLPERVVSLAALHVFVSSSL